MAAVTAVVAWMSVQPTSDRRTALQLSGSPAKAEPDASTAARQRPAASDFIRNIRSYSRCGRSWLGSDFLMIVSQTPFSRRFKQLARRAAATALLRTTAGVQIDVQRGW